MTVAIFPGTFDPITNGHVDVATRAAGLFERVIIGVYDSGDRSRKQPLFSVEERTQLATEALAHVPNIDVDRFDGLLVDYANRVGAHAIVRGLRAVGHGAYQQHVESCDRDGMPDDEFRPFVHSRELSPRCRAARRRCQCAGTAACQPRPPGEGRGDPVTGHAASYFPGASGGDRRLEGRSGNDRGYSVSD